MAELQTQDKAKTSPWLLWLLAATVLLTLYMSFQGDDAPAADLALNKPARNVQQSIKPSVAKQTQRRQSSEPMEVVDEQLFAGLSQIKKQDLPKVGNAFEIRSWYVAPPKPVIQKTPEQIEQEQEAAKPKVPPVPFKYVGKFNETQIYLQQNDDLYTVEVGDVLKTVWRIERDEEAKLVLTYIPLDKEAVINKN